MSACTRSGWTAATSGSHPMAIADLPDAAFVVIDGAPSRCAADSLLYWAPDGYATRRPRPRSGTVDVLTPPAIVAALSAGYSPRWHPSCVEGGAERC